jgi:1,4-dihydroxy-2-naphthoyl-CoA hydrolase
MAVATRPDRCISWWPRPSSTDVSFSVPFVVRFGEVDAAGVVYFARIFDYAHRAYEDLLVAMGLPLGRILADDGWGMPLVHAEADFSRPMRLGESLIVDVSIAELAERRVSFAFAIRDAEGTTRATVRCDHAFVDMATFRGRSAPSDFVEAAHRLGL